MVAATPLRPDFCTADLRALARASKDTNQTRRLLALVIIYDGSSRQAIAELGGVRAQIIRDWVSLWRLKDLVQWVYRNYHISIDKSTLGRVLKAMGCRKLSARPHHHAQNELQSEHSKETFPQQIYAIQCGLPTDTAIELWWQDEARIGQKNKITRRWARCGTRPSAPQDQRTSSAYIFGAICAARGKGASLVMT